jgi:two-component system phosphate regulon sensor histidine kinase PhoR
MKPPRGVYRKNFSLIIVFMVLISVTLVIALVISYNLTSKYVENEFASKKIDVLEETIKPYNDFFLNKIPEITLYQGYLTNASAVNYSTSVFRTYPFVKKMDFYEISIGSKQVAVKGGNNLDISIKSVYQYQLKKGVVKGIQQQTNHINEEDFSDMAVKLNDYIANSDTTRGSTPDEIFRIFYDVKPDKISYMNILRREDIKIYRDLQNHIQRGAAYKQNMMTFLLNPYMLKVKNSHKELYQSITIKPVVYYPLDNDPGNNMTTEVAFPGAFSNYKLYFKSADGYLTA